ncbi:MAG: hypothetical protein HGB21_11900 [Nitrospirae bacterium]|nr:hypothetical protein [Nitrospirota bacterium]NTW66988.1 hypothetical protein [Nitrospirota bacterium]
MDDLSLFLLYHLQGLNVEGVEEKQGLAVLSWRTNAAVRENDTACHVVCLDHEQKL